jgi:hypothetical protein
MIVPFSIRLKKRRILSLFFLPLSSGKLTEKLENKVDMRISVELRKS